MSDSLGWYQMTGTTEVRSKDLEKEEENQKKTKHEEKKESVCKLCVLALHKK
jgi:hypothetical protein